MAIRPGIVKLRPPMDVHKMVINLFFAECHCLDIKWSRRHPFFSSTGV
jgi:hypothetical protein